MNENSVRSVTGTGANVDVFCGFIPARVTVVNVDSATGDQMEWFIGMTDGHAFKTTGSTRSKITSNGITLLRDATFGFGFRIGADAAVNIATQRMVVLAERGGEGNQEPSYSVIGS